MSRAAKKFNEWHEFPPSGRTTVRLKQFAGEMAVLGLVREIVYVSDKYDPGNFKTYKHVFGRGVHSRMPGLVLEPNNEILLVMGGEFTVGNRGIVG